jgi:hypothetical protein
MATHRSGHRPGGGIASSVVKHSTNPKREPIPHARNPATVAQYGALVGNHATHQGKSTPYRGEPDFTRKGYSPQQGPTSMALSGPGAGREVLRSGGQGTHGSVNPGMSGLPSTKGQWPDAK